MARIKQIRKRRNLPFLYKGMRLMQHSTGRFGCFVQPYGPALNISVMWDHKFDPSVIIALEPLDPCKGITYFDKKMNIIKEFYEN